MKKIVLLTLLASLTMGRPVVNADVKSSSTTVSIRQVPQALATSLNNQLKEELDSAYYYLAVSNYFEELGLLGHKKWFDKQSKEELEHTERILTFMQQRDIPITFPMLNAPKVNFTSPADAFRDGLEREQKLTLKIRDLYHESQRMNEYEIGAFLQYFLKEQIEEEDLFRTIVKKLNFVPNGNGTGLLILDQQLADR